MNKKVLVTGANGQLGQSIRKNTVDLNSYEFTYIDYEELDFTQPDTIPGFFKDKTFDLIINCAAHTAVDKAESEPELADKINHQSVREIAKIAKEKNIKLVHVSTDYVFNGESFKPYIESDATGPESVYGDTKLKGELAVQDINPNGIIIRTSWVYSEFGNNFVKTMLRLGSERDELGVIFDQVGTPTYAGDLAQAIIQIIHADTFGQLEAASSIYHFSNEGVASWYDFAVAIFELSDTTCKVNPIETAEYPTPAKRPPYSLLNKKKIKEKFNLQIPYWKESLKTCLASN